jgi:glycylpeptide N-tetradecanoyltransferase
MKFALAKAKSLGYDVFNALDIMENSEFLEELKFGVGDGYLHYYFYNYHLQERLVPSDIGIVLV